MSKREQFLFKLFVIVVQALQFAAVYMIALFNSRIIEFLIIFISFQCNRMIFGKSYHADQLSKCTLLTLVIFYFLIRGALPLNMSLFMAPLFGVYLSYLLNYIQELIDNQNVPKPFIKKRLREQLLDILGDDLSEDHIEEMCVKNGIHLNVTETVYLYLTNSKDDVASILEIEGTTVIRRVKKFIEKTTQK